MSQAKNKYLESVIPKLYRRQTFDTMIYTFIDTYRFLIPSVNIQEAALAFMKRYNVSEDHITVDAVIQSYYRTLHLVTDAKRQENIAKSKSS